MEATPGYFYGGRVLAQAISGSLRGVKIVVVLRNPVKRLVSFYRFYQSMLAIPATMTLADYVASCDAIEPERFRDRELEPWFGVQGGYYDAHLVHWLETFGTDLRVLFFDDLIGNPRATLGSLASWLGISAEPFDREQLDAENRSVPVRHRGVQRVALALNHRLEPFFRARPNQKRLLRALYYHLNGAPAKPGPPQELLYSLAERYAASNRRTAAQLRAAGYTEFPVWLTGEKLHLHQDGSM